jgi:hypothetical protein
MKRKNLTRERILELLRDDAIMRPNYPLCEGSCSGPGGACPIRAADHIEGMMQPWCNASICVIIALRRRVEDDEGEVESDEEARLALLDYWQRHDMD